MSRARLLSTLARLEPCVVVLEACAASHHWGRCIRELGHPVKLIAPKLVQPYRRGQKNDYRDAEAMVSAALAPRMHFVVIKTLEQQAEQALHRFRSRLQSHRNAAANGLRGLLGEYGVVFPRRLKKLREGARGYAETEQAFELGLVGPILDVLDEIEYLEQRMAHYERLIETRVKTDEISGRLRQELRRKP